MDEKPVALVPFNFSLAPADATVKDIYLIITSNLTYEGQVTIALTKDTLWIVTPEGRYEQIPLKSIEDVKLDNFPGFVYKEVRNGIETHVAPNDTAGVTIEYRKIGRLKHRVSFLTRFPNLAQQWIRLISEAINALYQPPPNAPTETSGE